MARKRIFVSHSHVDDAFCRVLVAALREAGADVWYDEHNMDAGPLLDVIEVELRARSIFVVILSPAALKSQWVRDESKWAFNLRRRRKTRIILPVIASTVRERDIWLFLQDYRRIEAKGLKPLPQDEALRQTLEALHLLIDSTPPPGKTG